MLDDPNILLISKFIAENMDCDWKHSFVTLVLVVENA
jgi:hypothetical protein